MKITIASFIITVAATLLNIEASNREISNNNENKNSLPSICGFWYQGKVPYEISQQFDGNDLNLIKEALLDIMKTTCIKFVPHTNEPDYVVFVEYKHPYQDKKKCWSGKEWDENETSTIGNHRGRHIVSLWRELECFNKFDIIRHMSNILGFKTKSPTLNLKNGRSVYAAYKIFEGDLDKDQQETKTRNVFRKSCEKELGFLKNYTYAADKKEWAEIAKNDSCTVLRAMILINRMYNCPAFSNSEMDASNLTNSSDLGHVRPNCKTEADAGACKSDPTYMAIICHKSFCDGWGILYNGNRSARMGHLVNGFGKGLFPYTDSSLSGYTLHQGRADHTSWSWNEPSIGSGDRHLCNHFGKCATSYKIDPIRPKEPSFIRQEDPKDMEGQRFYFLELLAHPGFFIIKEEFGKCLAIYGNTDRVMSEVRALDCNPLEAGQRWKWSYP